MRKKINFLNIQHFYVCNEQMNEEELPIDKNYKELKAKLSEKFFDLFKTYLIH
jgi:hypothetical protein